jgi:hypothetical protein
VKKPVNTCLLIFASGLLLLVGCKLDQPVLPAHPTTSGGGNTPPPVNATTYLPVTKGSYWKYAINSGGVSDVSTTTMTGNTQVFYTKTYYEATATSQLNPTPQIGYFYYGDHIYRQREVAEGNTLDLYVLNDTELKGHSWKAPLNETGLVNGVPGQLIGTIIEKGITKTVMGKVFNNVIHTELEIQYDYGLGNGFETAETTDMFFALGIGIIEADTNIPGFGTATTQIIDYSIK